MDSDEVVQVSDWQRRVDGVLCDLAADLRDGECGFVACAEAFLELRNLMSTARARYKVLDVLASVRAAERR